MNMPDKRGKKPKMPKAPNIKEAAKISLTIQIDKFLKDGAETDLKFPSFLSKEERAFVHSKALKLGLKSKSRGNGPNRYITVFKRSGSTLVQKDAKLFLDARTRTAIGDLLTAIPITPREKEELSTSYERERAQSIQKDTGYLSGSPNIPHCQINPDVAMFKQTLPVFGQKDQIINTINSNQCVVVVGETGSGKTTQIPQLILEQYQQEKKVCRIICTQPRRISAIAVAERVAYERNEKVGNSIGYQIRLESRISPKTVLTYCTNGVLLRTLMGRGSALASITHVFVDEVHERDKLSDFLLISLKDALSKFRDLRVVLMSATIDPTIFSRYFHNCPVITIPGRTFEVEKYYLDDILPLLGYYSSKMKRIKASLNSAKKEIPTETKESHPKAETVSDAAQNEQPESTAINDAELQAEVDEFLNECFVEGSLDSFIQILYMYMSEGVPVDAQHSTTGMTGLMAAAHHGLLETMEQIIKMGGDPRTTDKMGRKALDYAKASSHAICINFLENITTEEVKNQMDTKEQPVSEDNELLDVYNQSISEDSVDTNLILALIKHIHLTQPKGSILVFLTGYDDIITLRDLVQSCQEMEAAKYQLFTLHSNMQTFDQKRVFTHIPDTRKIIIATNIAETSITIDDVVYVIDCGKVKEMYFESASGVCSLQVVWVSKACSQQRAGRAGRTQPGKSFTLYSRRLYESLLDNSIPEMLRVPLHELCLHSKLLAPSNTSIADFLSKALEPPSFASIRNSVNLLKTIGALTVSEDLTEIGQHLLDLTIEPKLGKMLLYACILKCLDPVLTIACILACNEPFLISPDPEKRKLGGQSRRNFAADTFSDHMALLRAFQAWQQAKANHSERAFCSKNLINGATMEMVVGLRAQLLAQLRAIGLVKSRGPGDIKDSNLNSEKWFVIKAVLVSGLYPSIARVDREENILRSSKEVKLAFHPSSTLYSAGGRMGLSTSLSELPTDWLVFEEISRVGRFCFIRCNTLVTPITVALFGGPLRLPTNALRCHVPGIMDDSDTEDENEGNGPDVSFLSLDDWVGFYAESNDALSIYLLRQKFAALMIRRMVNPSKTNPPTDDKIIETIVNALGIHERLNGLIQPIGIGQRPKPVLVEYQRPNSESSRMRNLQQDFSQFNVDGKSYPQLNQNNYPSQYKQGTSTFSNNMSYLTSKQSKPQPNYPTALKQESEPQQKQNVPNRNVLLANIEKYSVGPSDNTSEPQTKYFCIKASNQKVIEESQNTGKWEFVSGIDKRISKACEMGNSVVLFFSVGGNVCKFFGYAKFTDTPNKSESSKFHEVNWITTNHLPHHVTRHLNNGLDGNRRIAASRDGQEISSNSAQALMTLLDHAPKKFPHSGRPIQKQPN